MKVAVTTGMVPFRRSPAEARGAALVRELERAGHEAELVRLPFRLEPYTALPEQLTMTAQIALGVADVVIALAFPAYLAPHPKLVVWVDERFAPAYDDESGFFPADAGGERVRDWVVAADTQALVDARRVFVTTDSLREQLLADNGVAAELLAAPAADGAAAPGDWPAIVERLLG